MKRHRPLVLLLVCTFILFSAPAYAQAKKGLLVYDSIYGSTVEVAYWIKEIIGHGQHLEVKSLAQVITVDPYDYVIIGSPTRQEKPTEKTEAFIAEFLPQLKQKQVCYFLLGGDTDETMVLKVPGSEPRLIAGRNYLFHTLEAFPEIKPVVIAGVGGRTVGLTLNKKDSVMVWLVSKLAKEGDVKQGRDIFESLVPERVEAFANEVRVKILGLQARTDIEQLRVEYWNSLQPAKLTNRQMKKQNPRAFEVKHGTERIYYVRMRAAGDLDTGISFLTAWSQQTGMVLQEKKKTFYNAYYHGLKQYGEVKTTVHIVAATLPEDPGFVHYSFRCYDTPDKRKGAEEDIQKAVGIMGKSI